jgi:hypothetical protein
MNIGVILMQEVMVAELEEAEKPPKSSDRKRRV